ncbi:IS701 family transposase [Fimbriiglobus ruber]|uniref:Mobile element protein n=1 Tax=Fimbriiglobus ruber TaxID=1908690 RepID=A0A225DJK9_9BACT|nr:IS701 family transposase [Fimbriiglobus ruber]OWK41143.1 Mobile element protein [Fimbriiglobus ruber]
MDDRFNVRLREMMAETELTAGVTTGLLERLRGFVVPFAASLSEPEQRTHTHEYVSGLLSPLERKTGEAIAYLHEHERQGIQKFMGHVPWDHRPRIAVLAEQVSQTIGEPDGVIVFDPSGFAKKGTNSVGVARPWCGRQGKIDNCQVGVYLGYVSRRDPALVDVRLYLPEAWTRDRTRCRKAGVPKAVRFRTRHEQAREMLAEHGPRLPHRWVTGDDEMGRSASFRRELRARGESYVLAVPSNTLVRDDEADPPVYTGRGRRPGVPFGRVDRWVTALPTSAWTTITVRDGEKGPLAVDVVCRRVTARMGRKVGAPETLFVTRERLSDGGAKHDYYLASAADGTTPAEFARVTKAAHEIEECFRQAKSQAGWGDYQVRNGMGWHHHQTLALIASWFLSVETRRGEKRDPGSDGPAMEGHHRQPVGGGVGVPHPAEGSLANNPLAPTDRTGTLLLASCA